MLKSLQQRRGAPRQLRNQGRREVHLVGLVRNHTLLIDSRVRIEASKWNESESFVFVSSRLCSFLYFCWGFYCSVLDKGFLWLFFRLARDVLGLVDVATEKLSERNGTKTHNFPLIFRATFALCYVKNSRYFFATFFFSSVSQRRTHFGNVARQKSVHSDAGRSHNSCILFH